MISGDWQGESGVVGGDWSQEGWEQKLLNVGAGVSREQGVVGCGQDGGGKLGEADDYDFPSEHWKHLRTCNVVESPFSRARLRTAASRRLKSQVNATRLIWKTMMVAEMSFRKLDVSSW